MRAEFDPQEATRATFSDNGARHLATGTPSPVSVSAVSDERFEPREDPRPDDVHWPVAQWPPHPGEHLRGTWVELVPTTQHDAHDLRLAIDHDPSCAPQFTTRRRADA